MSSAPAISVAKAAVGVHSSSTPGIGTAATKESAVLAFAFDNNPPLEAMQRLRDW